MRAKQSLGQNFLMHQATADRIAGAARLSKGDTVLEIGPGTGMLTRSLLARAGKVIAIEADASLIPGLEATFEAEIRDERLILHHADVRSFDPSTVSEPYKLVANIPYYITGEIFRQFLSAEHQPTSMTLLVQKEVAERIAREPKESLLSLSIKVYGNPKYEFTVPRGAFRPSPKVDSAVISISDIGRTAFKDKKSEEIFFEMLRVGFAHKRKILSKNLSERWSKEKVHAVFDEAGLEENIRAEGVSLRDWKKLAHAFQNEAN